MKLEKQEIVLWCNGNTTDFDSVFLGSSPGRTTNFINMKKLFKYFTNYGVNLCDDKLPEYGGHAHWLCKLLKIEYLWIGFCKPEIGIYHDYYEGFHHCLYLGIFAISWAEDLIIQNKN